MSRKKSVDYRINVGDKLPDCVAKSRLRSWVYAIAKKNQLNTINDSEEQQTKTLSAIFQEWDRILYEPLRSQMILKGLGEAVENSPFFHLGKDQMIDELQKSLQSIRTELMNKSTELKKLEEEKSDLLTRVQEKCDEIKKAKNDWLEEMKMRYEEKLAKEKKTTYERWKCEGMEEKKKLKQYFEGILKRQKEKLENEKRESSQKHREQCEKFIKVLTSKNKKIQNQGILIENLKREIDSLRKNKSKLRKKPKIRRKEMEVRETDVIYEDLKEVPEFNLNEMKKNNLIVFPAKKILTCWNKAKQLDWARGAFGSVRIVRFEEYPGELFALKRVNIEYKEGGDYEEGVLFSQREQDILIHSNHPHICEIFGVGAAECHDGIRNIRFTSRFTLMKFYQPFRIDQCVHWNYLEKVTCLLQVAKGIEFLHSRKIIHRDIKVGNLWIEWVEKDFIMKIIDFGLSKVLHSENAVTQKIRGTPDVMAPETFQERNEDVLKYGQKSDVYSFSIFMFQVCLKVENPYPIAKEPNDIFEMLGKVKKKETYRPLQVFIDENEGGSETVKEVFKSKTMFRVLKLIVDCWNSDPKERPHISNVVKTLELVVKELKEKEEKEEQKNE